MFRAILFLTALVSSAYALVHGVDSSQLVSVATYTKARGEGFTKAIIRGYQEACGSGGRVDPNFVQTYKNARSAGITNIDMYWFPCTGSGNPCKSFATQLSEIANVFKANSMNIGTIWIDIEKDSVCNNWNYGTSGNLSKAKEMIAAIKATGFKFGIYSSPGEWGNIFGSTGVVLDSSAPLWFATWNNVETLTMGTKFGGWSSAVGHQYTDVSASAVLISSAYALVYAVDSSQLVPTNIYTQAFNSGYSKAIIRGYRELCGSGGAVDSNFVQGYFNARSAGFTHIDVYWFPCNGSGNSCKSYATQISELSAVIKANGMLLGRVWVDIERSSACNNWNYGSAGNLSQAKSLIAAMKATGYNYGIYSSPGEWSAIFGSASVVLDSAAPLWFATWNNAETLTLGTKFGGWTTATGHQYTDQSSSGYFDLSVFSA
ncbi:hypothetical protein CVT24_010926 [Panaeolus cyanescens]|uniref:Glycoside hydrolase family 25 protein n=1 Tax=Panaeolus cyanescens TaxID=181874 RepID=A0A409WDD1_9AGAR|nr:hypothetical protein CVT24_010926 [Panaeolus cyanescens]